MAVGECLLGLNGPFLWTRLGLNVPEAAAVGTGLGAALGYAGALAWIRLRRREPLVVSARAIVGRLYSHEATPHNART